LATYQLALVMLFLSAIVRYTNNHTKHVPLILVTSNQYVILCF